MLNKILQFLWILILLPASLLGCTGGDASEGVTPSQTALPISTPIEVETPSPNPSSLPFLPIITGNLAFSSRRDDTNNDGTLDSQDGIHLYKLDLETNALLKLTDGDQWDIWPEWSPDGEHLAFTSNREGDDHIYIVNADGSNMRQLTTGLGHQGQPCWSPNGQQIAYIQSEGVLRSNGDLFAINIDGTNMIQITSSVGNETAPDWLPDGRYIIFSREEYGDRVENFIGQIWIYDIKTKTEWQLVPDVIGYPSDLTLSFEQPRWLHPDGQFVSLSVVTLTMDTIHYAFGVYEFKWVDGQPQLSQKLLVEDLMSPYTWGENNMWIVTIIAGAPSQSSLELAYIPLDYKHSVGLQPLSNYQETLITSNEYYDNFPDWTP